MIIIISWILDWIRPLCLPVAEEFNEVSYDDVSMKIVGWGNTEESKIFLIIV